MKRDAGGGPSLRLLRVGESLRHALAEILLRGEVHAPALTAHSITVSQVRVSPDLRHATVFVMPLGGKDAEETLLALARLAGPLAHAMSRRVRMKYTPKLVFQLDRSFAEASHIEALLRSPKVARDLGPAARAQDEGEDG
ncbi:MAG: 30S ribosome-binding factor RbfA [Pseudomonadota bacterium]